jgi:hypothetical protein
MASGSGVVEHFHHATIRLFQSGLSGRDADPAGQGAVFEAQPFDNRSLGLARTQPARPTNQEDAHAEECESKTQKSLHNWAVAAPPCKQFF